MNQGAFVLPAGDLEGGVPFVSLSNLDFADSTCNLEVQLFVALGIFSGVGGKDGTVGADHPIFSPGTHFNLRFALLRAVGGVRASQSDAERVDTFGALPKMMKQYTNQKIQFADCSVNPQLHT